MKKAFIVFLIIFLFLLIIFQINNNPKLIIANLLKNGDIESNYLKYRVYLFGIIPAGEAEFFPDSIEEANGERVVHLSAIARNLKAYSPFFNSSAMLDSYVNTQTLSPNLFRMKLVVSGKQKQEREVIYDQKNGVMTILGVKRQIFNNTQDPLSAIFNIRKMNFDGIEKFEVNINTNQKNYILNAAIIPRDIFINGKKCKTLFLKSDIKRRDKNPYHKSNVDMVLLKEPGKDNLPVLIKVFASGFFVNAKLIDSTK